MVTVKGTPHWITSVCLLPEIPPERKRQLIVFYKRLNYPANNQLDLWLLGEDYKFLILPCANVVDKEPVYIIWNLRKELRLRSMHQNKMREKIWEQNLETLGKKYEDHDFTITFSKIFPTQDNRGDSTAELWNESRHFLFSTHRSSLLKLNLFCSVWERRGYPEQKAYLFSFH